MTQAGTALILYNRAVKNAHNKPVWRYSPSVENLRSLTWIRGAALLVQAAVLGYAASTDALEGLLGPLVALAAMALLTILTLWRLQRGWPVSDREFAAQLLLDVLLWSVLMYVSGGANNPFISYLIVPLVIAGAILPVRLAWLVTLACLSAYSLLLFYYRPFELFTPHAGMHHGDSGQLHVLGMWLNFLFSAGLITYFVVRMAALLRAEEERAVVRREDRLRNEQIVAVASLAAGTAHRLGTPMATMTVLVDEMLADPELSTTAREDCLTLAEQLRECRETLARLTATAQLRSTEQRERFRMDEYVREIADNWAVRYPQATQTLEIIGTGLAPEIAVDGTLAQAIENLLDNAANAGSERIAITLDWTPDEAALVIRDWGSGIPLELLEQIGKPQLLSDTGGLGLGLLLSHATVERYGGQILLRNHPEGGAETRLTLPLSALNETTS